MTDSNLLRYVYDYGGGYEGRLAPLDLDLLNGDLTEWAAVLGQATQDKDE